MAGIGRASARRLGPALAACALAATVAAGHAVLQRAEPRVESKLKRAPEEVKLYFTERLEPAYSSFRVLNDQGVQAATATSWRRMACSRRGLTPRS